MWNIVVSSVTVSVYSSVPPASLDTFKAQKGSNILCCSGALELGDLEKNFPIPQECKDVFTVPSLKTHPETNPIVYSWGKIPCSLPHIRGPTKTFNLRGQTETFKWLGSNRMWFCREGEFAKPPLHVGHPNTSGTAVQGSRPGWLQSW